MPAHHRDEADQVICMGSLGRVLVVLCIVPGGCASERIVVLETGSARSDDLQLQLAVQRDIDRAPPVYGNRVDLLRDGPQAFPAMFDAMQHAQDSINMEFYTFDDVRSGGRTLGDLLVDRLRHGVAVSIIYDAFGSNDTPAAFIDRLAKAGAVMVAFNREPLTRGGFRSPNDRDHRKLLVVDGRIGFMGGINLDHVYEMRVSAGGVERPWLRDTAVRITGPVVADLQRVFFSTWTQQHGPPLQPRNWFPTLAPTDDETVRILASQPGDGKPLYYVWLLHALHAARRSISLSTGYFVPTHQEREELASAARRGVRVRLVLPSQSDSQAAIAAGRAAYGDLLEAGVKIYEVQNAVLHSKFIIIDGVSMAIGSSNFDRRSAVFNNELDAIVLGSRVADGEAVFDQDIGMSKEIDLRTWRSRPMSERLLEWQARLWEFLL
jgi:cardiolipin synthase A/B